MQGFFSFSHIFYAPIRISRHLVITKSERESICRGNTERQVVFPCYQEETLSYFLGKQLENANLRFHV